MNNIPVSVMGAGSAPELNGLLLGTLLQVFVMEPAVVIWADDGRAKGNVRDLFVLRWKKKERNCASFLHQGGDETNVCSSFSLTTRIESLCLSLSLLLIRSWLCHSLSVDVVSSKASRQSSPHPAFTRPPNLSAPPPFLLPPFSFICSFVFSFSSPDCRAVCQCQSGSAPKGMPSSFRWN